MDDNELRAGLAELLRAAGTAAPVRVPPMSAIKRRMRRRQIRQASAGVVACACVAVAALLVRGAAAGPTQRGPADGGSLNRASGCAAQNLSIRWLGKIPLRGIWIDPPPETFLLGLRNTGRRACAVRGWPRLTMTQRPARTSIFYRTHIAVLLPSGKTVLRIVEPTRVVLRAGATAISAVTVVPTPALTGCDQTKWRVASPVPGSAGRAVAGGPRLICAYTSVEVSPVYPKGVPISQNYPWVVMPTSHN